MVLNLLSFVLSHSGCELQWTFVVVEIQYTFVVGLYWCYQTHLFTGIEQSFESMESGIGAFTIKGGSASATMPTVCLRNLFVVYCYISLIESYVFCYYIPLACCDINTFLHVLQTFGDIVV